MAGRTMVKPECGTWRLWFLKAIFMTKCDRLIRRLRASSNLCFFIMFVLGMMDSANSDFQGFKRAIK